MTKTRAILLGRRILFGAPAPLLSLGIWLFWAGSAAAIPVHSPSHFGWQDGLSHHHHFHDNTHAANPHDANAGHDVGHQLSGNQDYDAYGRWDNEIFDSFDAPNSFTWNLATNTGAGATGPDSIFSHGYIDEHPLEGIALVNIPEYSFVTQTMLTNHLGAAFDAAPLVRQAFAQWSAITTDDPVHTKMGLEFREKILAETIDISVSFIDIPTASGAVAFWSPATQSLVFDTTDPGPDNMDGGGDDVPHAWYNGANLAGLANNSAVDDFFTVALHEIGHVVGLDHQIDVDDVMHVFAGNGQFVNANANASFRSLSDDDILGARDLYIIPEPGSAVLLTLGMLGMMLWRRRRSVC